MSLIVHSYINAITFYVWLTIPENFACLSIGICLVMDCICWAGYPFSGIVYAISCAFK